MQKDLRPPHVLHLCYRWSLISSPALSHVSHRGSLNEHMLPIASRSPTTPPLRGSVGGKRTHLKPEPQLSGPGPPKQWCNTQQAYVTNLCWQFPHSETQRACRPWELSHQRRALWLNSHAHTTTQWSVNLISVKSPNITSIQPCRLMRFIFSILASNLDFVFDSHSITIFI